MTWRNQIQSSKYIKGVATCTGLQNTDIPTEAVCPNGDGTFSFGGGGKQMTLATGSYQQYPSVYRGAAGSASAVYSSDKILLQKAGRAYCAELITDQDTYTIMPNSSVTVNTNGPTSDNPNPAVNNQDTNTYLPPFDTYYNFKNRPAPVIDQNQKHYVQYCNGCVVEPIITRYGWPLWMVGTPGSLIISNSVTYYGNNVYVVGTFSGTIRVFDGTPTPLVTDVPTITMTSVSTNLDAFLITYDQSGKLLWFTTIQTIGGTQTTMYNVTVDASGIYLSGYMDGTIQIYDGIMRDNYLTYGPVRASLSPTFPSLFVIKYALYGIVAWSSMVEGITSQAAPAGPEIQPTLMNQICTDGKNVYLCNSIDATTATVTVYGSDGVAALTLSNGGNGDSQQAFLVQYNSATGMTNWATRMTGSLVGPGYAGTTNAQGLICDVNNVYMTGYFNNTVNCYDAVTSAAPVFGASQAVITNGINNGMYIVAYNKSGTFQWINQGNITNFSFIPMGVKLAIDATGVYVVVPFPDVISFNTIPGGGSFIQLINTGGASTYNIGIVKYTFTGTLVWMNKILNVDNGSGTIYTNGFGISSDGSGLYVTGGFGANTIGLYNSSTSGDPTPQVATLTTAGGTNTNTFLVKYNLLGTLLWSTLIGRSGSYAYGYSVAANTNVIYVTGMANGAIDFYHSNGLSQPNKIAISLDPGAGTYFYTYVAKYDHVGQVLFG